MIWYLIVGYVVVSQILVVGGLAFTLFGNNCVEEEEQVQPGSIRGVLAKIILILAGFVFAPILAPVLCYLWRRCSQEISEEIEYWNSVQQSHYDMRLDPLHNDNLNDELRVYFEEQSAAPLALDYQLLGDFWMKDEPFNSKARIFLHPQGHTFAETGNTLDVDYCEILSFLDDGSVVSSANCDPLDIHDELAEHRYYVECYPGLEMVELLEKHEQLLSTTQEQTEIAVRKIPVEQWKDYFHYHNRRFGEIKFLIGKATESPSDVDFPASESEQHGTALNA